MDENYKRQTDIKLLIQHDFYSYFWDIESFLFGIESNASIKYEVVVASWNGRRSIWKVLPKFGYGKRILAYRTSIK